jgi:hypothetical protein
VLVLADLTAHEVTAENVVHRLEIAETPAAILAESPTAARQPSPGPPDRAGEIA